jgi:hypothetical protein
MPPLLAANDNDDQPVLLLSRWVKPVVQIWLTRDPLKSPHTRGEKKKKKCPPERAEWRSRGWYTLLRLIHIDVSCRGEKKKRRSSVWVNKREGTHTNTAGSSVDAQKSYGDRRKNEKIKKRIEKYGQKIAEPTGTARTLWRVLDKQKR